jgi:HPt (histidine-containing phosphotransfer) domain-containing protein
MSVLLAKYHPTKNKNYLCVVVYLQFINKVTRVCLYQKITWCIKYTNLFARISENECPATFSMRNHIKGNAILSSSDLNIFDAQFALNQFSGNQSLLVQILEKFCQQYQHFDTSLTAHLQQENIHAAKQEIHTIKGVSGNLGMQALHHACKELEGNLAQQPTENALKHFLDIFRQTLTLVENFSTEISVETSPNVAPQQDEKAALIAALKRSEFISDSKMQSYEQSLNLSSEKLNELKLAIDNLDYGSAIQLLE